MSSPQTVIVTDANFEEEVVQSTLPVLVDFWATWCPPCRMLSPVIDEIAIEKAGVAKVAKVNVDENQELARRFKVQSIPLLLFFKDGEVKDQLLGAAKKKDLITKLEALG
jgi:thioredoxin 1